MPNVNRKHNWKVFLEYAKTHPNEVPKSVTERSQMYHSLMGQCSCGGSHKLCPIVHIQRVQLPQQTSIKDDPVILKAEIKALKKQVKSLQKSK